MRGEPLPIVGRSSPKATFVLPPSLKSALRIAGCFVAVTLATSFIAIFHAGLGGQAANPVWIGNGVLLAYLLLAPRWRWPLFLAAGAAGMLCGDLLASGYYPETFLYTSLNLLEVALGAWLLRHRSAQLPDFTSLNYLLRFAAFALLIAPLIAGTFYTLYSVAFHHRTISAAFLEWGAVDSLGTAVTTPACVAIFRSQFRNKSFSWSALHYRSLTWPGLLAVFTLLTFTVPGSMLIAFVYPLLVMILVTLGLGWAAMATLFVAFAEGWWQVHSVSHATLSPGGVVGSVGFRLQVFVASAMCVLYTVSVVLESRRAAERRLQKTATLHELIVRNCRDAIIVSDLQGNCSFVSPAVEQLTGWTMQAFAEFKIFHLVHPDDQNKADQIVQQLMEEMQDATIKCRIRRKDESYLWIESKLRVILDPASGKPTGLMMMARDISERKIAEKRLKEAYSTVESLAETDPLTGLANRRRFDQIIGTEWRRGLREQKPLSLLMIDADMFKLYNDTYGHPRGDSCLKQIAEAMLDVVSRPGDLAARYGGEEFAVILPNTESGGALQVAQEICESMRAKRLEHNKNPFGIMTVSIGCATLVPGFGQHAANLVERADRALYNAKQTGRNRACQASEHAQNAADAHQPPELKSA